MNADRSTTRAIEEARIARLATVDEDGRPHVVPIVFAYQADRLYTPIDAKPKSVEPARLRRVQNIVGNPKVQVLIDHYDEDWTRLWWIQLGGTALLLEDGPEHESSLKLLEAKYPQYAEIPLRGRPIIKVEIHRVVRWGEPSAG